MRSRIPRDLKWGLAIAAVFVLHTVTILLQGCPFWSCCFPFTPIAPILWPGAAVMSAGICLYRAARSGVPARVERVLLSALLLLFIVDSVTDGDHRWFEVAMRRQEAKIHLDDLQAWTQSQLSSPQQLAVWEDKGLATNQLPIQCQNLPYHYYPLYRSSSAGGPFVQLGTGGWDMGWGYIIGRTDLSDPSPVAAGSPGSHWVKKLKPGIFIFAFDV